VREPPLVSAAMHQADLRKRAKAKLDMAADLRRVGPTLALADHRNLVAMQAAELEADALLLDAEADRLERGGELSVGRA
jgi:hypothetical protein